MLLDILIQILKLKIMIINITRGTICIDLKVISELIEKENSNSYIAKNKHNDKFIIYVDKEQYLEYGSTVKVVRRI